MLRPNEPLIHAGNARLYATDPKVGGERKARGLVPRDYAARPVGFYCPPMHAVDMPLIPRAEWPERCKDMAAQQSRLSDIRLTGNNGQPIPSLDQGQVGYCWAHSSTHAVMMVRARDGMPYVPLSAYAVAATIKRGADEGGWGAQSLDFITSKGVPAQSLWPQGDRGYQKYQDRPEVWANAALHKVTEGWVDLQAAQYDRTMSFEQEATLYLSRNPCVKDENWWSHSICGLDLVDGNATFGTVRNPDTGKLLTLVEHELAWASNDPVTGGFGVRILNSWSDQWGDRGMSVLTGSQAVSDGAVAPRATILSAA